MTPHSWKLIGEYPEKVSTLKAYICTRCFVYLSTHIQLKQLDLQIHSILEDCDEQIAKQVIET